MSLYRVEPIGNHQQYPSDEECRNSNNFHGKSSFPREIFCKKCNMKHHKAYKRAQYQYYRFAYGHHRASPLLFSAVYENNYSPIVENNQEFYFRSNPWARMAFAISARSFFRIYGSFLISRIAVRRTIHSLQGVSPLP